jgi:hypothetical protein
LPHIFVVGECEATVTRDFVGKEQQAMVRMVAVKGGAMVVVDVDSY